jgi:hypothetical protein
MTNPTPPPPFSSYLELRIAGEHTSFFAEPEFQKAYYVGAYARAVIMLSYHSSVSPKNQTFKTWRSNQIINFKNLDRIFEHAFRFEQKLKLRMRNDGEVRRLSHEIPAVKGAGISNAKISYAFVAGFDDYQRLVKEHPIEKKESNSTPKAEN